ncbi:hypothetical protein [Fluviicola taffensis]|uniref:Outer membrane transport energization protein TonB n=1 Tax=Fluviicola taffensis (strain DSM 16823 / NCIMB 13979 / RW262) TaxID=755732 RepID=F2IEI5_FLUTR|nr:hypothetical protein [Fluviicola taffensis]AEA44524.1 hypothetical protein Fluta_2539 [Fluviicola taffensis DSM 16823]
MEEFAFETVKAEEIKDRKVAGIIAASAFVTLLAILHFLGYRIPTPPLPEQLLYQDMEMELIPLELEELPKGLGGGGSGTPAKVEKAETTPPQTEQILTQSKSTTSVKSGNSNMNNTKTPTDNPPSGKNTSDNPFGTGGSGGGEGSGNGKGIGNDDGNGTGPGSGGDGSGGNVKRFLVEQPNTTNIKSNEPCKIILSVLVDPNGNIIGKPTFVKASSTTNDMVLINQVIRVVQNEARFNKANTTKNMKEAITIRIVAN